MLNRERKRADEAEERLKLERQRHDEERQRNAEERQRNEERIDALYVELREERQQPYAELRAERQQNQTVQQEMLAHIAENQSILARMLQQRQNGGDNGNGSPSAAD